MIVPTPGAKVQISRQSVYPAFENPLVEVVSMVFRPDSSSALMFCYSWTVGNTKKASLHHTYYGIVYWCGMSSRWVESFHADSKEEVQQRLDSGTTFMTGRVIL